MKHFLCACLFLILVCNAQAQRFVRPFNTIVDMQLSNPSDINTNVLTVAPFQFWTWYKGNLDTPNGTDTLNSQWLGAPAGNWKLQGGLFAGGTNTFLGNTNAIVITVKTVAELKALNPCGGVGTVFVQGYYESGDSGGRQVTWRPNDATPDDGFLVFRPNNELQCSGTWTSVFPQGTYTGFNLILAGAATNYTYNAVRDYTVSAGGAPLIWPRVASIVDTTVGPLSIVSNESMSGEDGNQIVGNSTNAVFFGHDGTNVSIKGVGISGGVTGLILSNWNGGIIEGVTFSSVTNGIYLINCTNIEIGVNRFGAEVLTPIKVTTSSYNLRGDQLILANSTNAGIGIGRNYGTFHGPIGDANGNAIIGFQDVSKGDRSKQTIGFGVKAMTGQFSAYTHNWATNRIDFSDSIGGSAGLFYTFKTNSEGSIFTIQSQSDGSGGSTGIIQFAPGMTNGSATIPFLFNSGVFWTSPAIPLFSIGNHNTNSLNVMGNGQIRARKGTASLPAYSFIDGAGVTGFYQDSANETVYFSDGGTTTHAWFGASENMLNGGGLGWSTGDPSSTGLSAGWVHEGTDTIGQRKFSITGTFAQKSRFYRQFTNATDYSRLAINLTAGLATITPESAGSSTPIQIRIVYDAVLNVIDAVGSGSPEGVLAAGIGSTYHRTDGGALTSVYFKETGANTTTGWVGK